MTQSDDVLVVHASDGPEVSVRRARGETSEAWQARALSQLERYVSCVSTGSGALGWGV